MMMILAQWILHTILDHLSAATPVSFPIFPTSFSPVAFASGIFNSWGTGINLCTKLIFSFCCNVIFMIPLRNFFQSNSRGLDSFDNSSLFCLVFPISQKVSPPLFICVLQGIAAGIGISHFLRAFSWCSWSPHPQVQSRRYHVIVLHYRALVSR